MFREMRRFKQKLSETECIRILLSATSGTLAVSGDDGYPYAVPLSFVYADSKIYFHCANMGHKLDGIKANNKVSFCIIDEDTIVPEKFTTYFRSVIVFGKAKILNDTTEKIQALKKLGFRYSPNDDQSLQNEINQGIDNVCCVEIVIDYMSGKEAKEYAILKAPTD